MTRLIGVIGLTAMLAGCEATPVLDPANYYWSARYYDEPLPDEKRFWSRGGKQTDD